MIFSDDEIYLFGESCQIGGLFACRVSSSYHCNRAFAVEESVASGAGTDSLSAIFLFIGESEIFCAGSSSDDERMGLYGAAIIKGKSEGVC